MAYRIAYIVFRSFSEHLDLSVKVLVDKFDARSFQLSTLTFLLAKRSVLRYFSEHWGFSISVLTGRLMWDSFQLSAFNFLLAKRNSYFVIYRNILGLSVFMLTD